MKIIAEECKDLLALLDGLSEGEALELPPIAKGLADEKSVAILYRKEDGTWAFDLFWCGIFVTKLFLVLKDGELESGVQE